MTARMWSRYTAVAVVVAAGLAACARGQQLYAGPGTVVQGRVQGPFVQQVNPYGLPGPPLYNPFPAPQVYVPALGPYLYGPVIVPPAYGYQPYAYQPGLPGPYVRTPQPYQGYQPRSSPPRFADPYARPPAQQKEQTTGERAGRGLKPASTAKPQGPTGSKVATPDREATQKAHDRTAKGRTRRTEGAKIQDSPAAPEPNKPAEQVHKPAAQPQTAKP